MKSFKGRAPVFLAHCCIIRVIQYRKNKGDIFVLEFKNNETILSQIISLMKKEIFGGRLVAGQKIKPIREFAAELSVNPNTVAKAYSALEEERLIVTDGTLGKFVTQNREYLIKKREEYLLGEAEEFMEEMEKCGVGKEEVVWLMKKIAEK